MRREVRRHEKDVNDKIIMYSIIGGLAIIVILTGLLIYSKSLSNDVKQGTLNLEEMANIAGNDIGNTESASTEMGKSVDESKNEIDNTTNSINSNTQSSNSINNTSVNQTKNNTTTNKTKSSATRTTNSKVNEEVKKELSFSMPVDGEISKEYAKDNLVYSETLKEWVTHMGIDIKAEKTTVVKAAESGTVKSIKNDPRYGLTIVIDHGDGYQTVYANLLTSEFVVEGEKVEKGQSIGTVGNTAVFEVADEPHLHFSILKDSIPVDPNAYLK